MFRTIFTALFLLLFARIDALTTFHAQFSEQGYWYAKALNGDPDLPEDVRFLACEDSDSLESKTCLDFFQNKLPKDSPELDTLKLWSHVCDKKIPESEKVMLQKDAELLNSSLQKYVDLFESIKKFWGITENTPIYVFNSKINDKQNNAGCPSNLQQDKIFAKSFQQLYPFNGEGDLISFDELTAEKIKEISKNNSTLMIIFENKEQLDKVRVLISDFDETKPMNIVYKNNRTYIFLKIDKDHSFEERLKELIKI